MLKVENSKNAANSDAWRENSNQGLAFCHFFGRRFAGSQTPPLLKLVKVESDGPISSPTRGPTRTLYERRDGVQLSDPKNLNFCGHLDVHTESELGPESDWK